MSRVRRGGDHRCPDCRMQRHVCVCTLLPHLPTRTRIVLVLHQLEARKTTNSGRLALRCLPNSELVIRGRDHRQAGEASEVTSALEPLPWQRPGANPVLLFPGEDALPLEGFADPGAPPITLVVPDGTWSQAARTRKRFAGLDAIPCARLPDGLVSSYRLRHDPRPGRLSTLQAIAQALALLENTVNTGAGDATSQALLRLHQVAIDRTLWTKGQLRAEEVTGGLPPAALTRGTAYES